MEAAKPAMFYDKGEDLKVHCRLCPPQLYYKSRKFGSLQGAEKY